MASPKASPKLLPKIDTSLEAWIYNIRYMLHFPVTILTVIGLLVAGAFAEIAPRKSLEFLDNVIGKTVFFLAPLFISVMIDWPTGLLAAVVSLIIIARLQRSEEEEGFSNDHESTKFVSSSHRWFVEKVLGETPIAISSDRISTSAVKDDDNRSNSASSMGMSSTSDSSSSSNK